MNKQAKRRLTIFQTYSQNLKLVKEQVNFINYEFKDDYICPLCLTLFPIETLNTATENPLTLEDVPPASLGGKPAILTCKKCNSESGHRLDNHLLNRLLELDFIQQVPGSKTKTKFKIGSNEMTGTFEYKSDGSIAILALPHLSDPKQAGKFNGELITSINEPITPFNLEQKLEGTKMRFSVKYKSEEHRAEIALLRIGYFLAFNAFGYGLILINNPGLGLVEIPSKQTPLNRSKLTPSLRSKLTPVFRSKLTPPFLV